SDFRGDYVPECHEGLLPRCTSTGCAPRPLVLGDPNWTRSADDVCRASGDSHIADEPAASRHRRRLNNVGGRRRDASPLAESLDGPYSALHSCDRDTDAECIAWNNGRDVASCEADTK